MDGRGGVSDLSHQPMWGRLFPVYAFAVENRAATLEVSGADPLKSVAWLGRSQGGLSRRVVWAGSGVRGDDERAGLDVHDAVALEGTECVSNRGSCLIGAFGGEEEALGDRGIELDDDVGDCGRFSCRVRLIDGQGVDVYVVPAGGAEHSPNNFG
jgi:hypothetical protein